MAHETPEGAHEDVEVYRQQLEAWGQELVDRAIEADLNGEDCAKIEQLVASAIKAGTEAVSLGTEQWSRQIFERSVVRRAKSSGLSDAVERLLEKGEASPFPTVGDEPPAGMTAVPTESGQPSAQMETATIQSEVSPHVDVPEAVSSETENVPRTFDQEKWQGSDLSAEAAYGKYCETVERLAEERIVRASSTAGPGDQAHIREVIERVRDRVIDAARSDGPIPFEQRLKLDPEFRVLSSRRTAAPEQKIAMAQEVRKEQPLKDFTELEKLRGAFPKAATNEPPEAISAVSADSTPDDGGFLEEAHGSPEQQNAPNDLKALKNEIDAQYAIIRTTHNEKGDPESKKKITVAWRTLDQLYQKEKERIAQLVDLGQLFGLVKPADAVATAVYEKKIPKGTARQERTRIEAELPDGAADAYYEAVRRRNDFANMLGAKGVEKDIAYDLNREFMKRAQDLEELKVVLERGEENAEHVLLSARAQRVLDWHGIGARQAELVLAAITPIVESYQHIPQKTERPKRPASEVADTELLAQLLLSGAEQIDLVPRSMLKQLVQNPNETVSTMAKGALVRLEEKMRTEEQTQIPTPAVEEEQAGFDNGTDESQKINTAEEAPTEPPASRKNEVPHDAALGAEDLLRFEGEGGALVSRASAAVPPDGSLAHRDIEVPIQEAGAAEVVVQEVIPLNHGVVRQFETKFDISEGALQDIEAFAGLSVGKQLFVLKNLEQIALMDIKKEAPAQQKEEWSKTPALQKIWKQAYSFGMNPEHRVAELEKELLAKQRGGSDADPARAKILAEQLANIEQLAKVAAEGPEVNVASDGALEMVYLEEDRHKLTPEQKKVIEEFNSAATEFAKFPREWGYEIPTQGKIGQLIEGVSKLFETTDRRRYEAVKARYALARVNTLQLRRDKFAEEIAADSARKGEDPEKMAMLGTNLWDERVELTQLFNNHPDAEVALQQIKDQNTIAAAAKEFWKSKGMFIAGGAAVRMATIAISGGIMLPAIGLIGAGVGAGIGNAEGRKLMKERRADGRMSEEDLREEIVATNAVTGKVIMGADGKPLKRQIREYTDAAFFTDRVDRLTEKLFDTTEPEERTLLEHKIAQTIALMSEKFERGMINFGGSSLEEGDERKGNTIANRLSFIQAMAKGQISNAVEQDALEAEIERITGLRQATIEDKRKDEIKKIIKKSAFIRGAFALGGAGFVEGVKQIVHFGEPGYLGVTTVKTSGGIQEVIPGGDHPPVTGTEHTPNASSYANAAPDSANPEAFNAANFDKNISDVVGRTPSPEELAALRFTGGVDDHAIANMDQHNALIAAISGSQAPLAHEQIETLLGKGIEVKSGDNLTHIMQEHLGAMKDLTPAQQENVIQNFIRSLSDTEKTAIGITNVNSLQIGQHIQLDKLNDILLHKQVGGENIITHAQHILPGSPVAPEHITPGNVPVESDPLGKFIRDIEARGTTASERTSLWYNLSEANKQSYIQESVPRHIHEDMNTLFMKGPFEEWPKEWLSVRGRDAVELLSQTEKTSYFAIPGSGQAVPPGYEWSIAEKIQKYISEHGLTREKGFVPLKTETVENFLKRTLGERVLREGPLPWLKS